MKAVVVGGRARADYLVEMLRKGNNEVVAINNNIDYCEYLSNRHDIDVVCGNGTKLHVLEEAAIDGFDICIALTDCDSDNLAVCQLAQHFYDIKSQVCIVSDPRNVEVFKRLGVRGVVNSTHLLAQAVEEATMKAIESSPRRGRANTCLALDDEDAGAGGRPKADLSSFIYQIAQLR